MDLLTTVMHELGHILGDSDLNPQSYPDELMSGTLRTGERHTSHLSSLDSFFARQKKFF